MKWRNHRLVSGTAVFVMTGHLLPALCAACGSIFPDAIEGRNYSSPSWKKHHRKESHYLLAYVILCSFLWSMVLDHHTVWNFMQLSIASLFQPKMLLLFVGYLSFWFFIGSILHILEDALCGKIPFYSLRHPIGIRLFYVGTEKEYLVAYLLTGLLISFRILACVFTDLSFSQGI